MLGRRPEMKVIRDRHSPSACFGDIQRSIRRSPGRGMKIFVPRLHRVDPFDRCSALPPTPWPPIPEAASPPCCKATPARERAHQEKQDGKPCNDAHHLPAAQQQHHAEERDHHAGVAGSSHCGPARCRIEKPPSPSAAGRYPNPVPRPARPGSSIRQAEALIPADCE